MPVLVGLTLLLILTTGLAVLLGSVRIQVPELLAAFRHGIESLLGARAEAGSAAQPSTFIVLQIRAPRVLASAVVGLALASSGAAMQAIFQNPLASPYLLGVASGANMGAALVIAAGLAPLLGGGALPLGAFLGAVFAVAAIYGLSSLRGGTPAPHTLILAGVALGALFSAVTSFLIFISGNQMMEIITWMMGSLGRAEWGQMSWLAPSVLPCYVLLIVLAQDLNALALGDEGAQHLGVRPTLFRPLVALLVTVMTGTAVAVAGTIGFVGLITPHAIRLILGPDHRMLIPASGLAGASFLVVADTLARTVIAPAELPVGIVTAVVGGPFFLYILLARPGGSLR
jgi:iron complex transport system permease protein